GQVLPFAEDEQEPAARPRQAPVKIPATTRESSGFKPRFKTPAIRRAQHTEPAEPSQPIDQGAAPAESQTESRQAARSGAREPSEPQSRIKREAPAQTGPSLDAGPSLEGPSSSAAEPKSAPAAEPKRVSTADPSSPRALLELASEKSKSASK